MGIFEDIRIIGFKSVKSSFNVILKSRNSATKSNSVFLIIAVVFPDFLLSKKRNNNLKFNLAFEFWSHSKTYPYIIKISESSNYDERILLSMQNFIKI